MAEVAGATRGMAGQCQQACRGLLDSLAARSARVNSAEVSALRMAVATSAYRLGGFHAHQTHEAGEVVRGRSVSRFIAAGHGPHHQRRGQVIANQSIMRRADEIVHTTCPGVHPYPRSP